MYEDIKDQPEKSSNLYFSEALKTSMLSYAKNARIISIILLVLLALGILYIVGTFLFLSIFRMGSFGLAEIGFLLPVTILYFAVLSGYAYLIYLLYSHSNILLNALKIEDQSKVELAYEKLATFFKWVLYYFVIIVVLYIVIMIGFLIFKANLLGNIY